MKSALLIVDDDAPFRAATRRLLWLVQDRLPLEILEAATGMQALDVIQRQKVDCMLLDNRMPGGTGIDWIPKLLAAAPNLPIVMVTGGGDERTAVEAMQKGAMDYLVKGAVTVEGLQRAIGNAMEKAQLRLTLERQRTALIAAERQRVMVESLATVCHHVGQPTTVVYAYLQMIMEWDLPEDRKQTVRDCLDAAEAIVSDIHRLQAISEYRTIPYLQSSDSSGNILDVPA